MCITFEQKIFYQTKQYTGIEKTCPILSFNLISTKRFNLYQLKNKI